MFNASIFALLMLLTMLPHLATQSRRTPTVVGFWESETCVVQDRDGNRTSSKSTFVFLEREWALEFVQFADDRCTRPTMKAFLAGQYRITEPSSVVPIAQDATFAFSHKAVTLYDQSLIAEANRVCSGDLSLRTVVARVARLLVDRARGAQTLIEELPSSSPEYTQDQLAAMVGSVREVVQRALKTLEHAGLIQMARGRIQIIDLEALEGWSASESMNSGR